MNDEMIATLESIDKLSFFTADGLTRDMHISRRLAGIIRRQPGYKSGEEMAISKTKSGEWRLFVRVLVAKGKTKWTDASLHDMAADIDRSDAAAALGHSTSPAKTNAARENGKRGGWEKGRPRKPQN